MSGVTAEEVTKFVLDGRAALFERVSGQERPTRDVTVLPTMAQLRTTRRIQGRYTLTEADCGRHFADSIGVATDFHHPRSSVRTARRVSYFMMIVPICLRLAGQFQPTGGHGM